MTQIGPAEKARLRVEVRGSQLTSDDASQIRTTLDRMLGLHVDLSAFYAKAKRDSRFLEMIERFRGVKPPRFPSAFEAVANAIACQQLSLSAGIHFLNRLTESYGAETSFNGVPSFAFPAPGDLKSRHVRSLRRLGFSTQKSRALIGIAAGVANGRLDLEGIESMTDDEALEYLNRLPGIGRWSSEYILLRGLGRVGVFPGDDVGARNGLKRMLGLARNLDYDGVNEALARWGGYRGLIYFHLRLAQLESSGYIRG